MEIEGKFRICDGVEAVELFRPLADNEWFTRKGPRLVFVDEYIDTNEHELVLNDVWLRRRKRIHGDDARWELKYRPEVGTSTLKSKDPADVRNYLEVTDESEIATIVWYKIDRINK